MSKHVPVDIKALDDEINQRWKVRQQQVKRHQIELPDLSEDINPTHQESPQIVRSLSKFNSNRGGLKANSLHMFASVIRHWQRFCRERDLFVLPLSYRATGEALTYESSAELVILYLKYLAFGDNSRSIATINQHRSQISSLYKHATVPINPATHPEVSGFLKGLKDDFVEVTGERYSQRQATPFRRKHLDILKNYYQSKSATMPPAKKWQLRRDLALVITCYATALRESEIGGIRMKHVSVVQLDDGKIKVMIERVRSKTSDNVNAKTIIGTDARFFFEYHRSVKERLGLNDFLFSHHSKHGKPISPDKPLSGMSVDRAFGRCFGLIQKAAPGLIEDTTKPFTGHSARIGQLEDGADQGLTLDELQKLGEWTSPVMVLRYLRGHDASIDLHQRLQR